MSEIENFKTVKARDAFTSYEGDQEEPEETPENPLDAEDKRHEHRVLMSWYTAEREKQSLNRYQMSIDEDFYDHLQWSEEDALVMQERGQAPLVYNEIKAGVDWIVGTEKRARMDAKVLPREEDDHDSAEVKTKLLKYLSDVSKTPYEESFAFKQAVKAGLGWIEDGINTDPEAELLYTRAENWRNVLYDSHSTRLDISDARYQFRWRWLDLDIAEEYFPDRKAQLKSASVGSEIFGPEQDEDLWYLGTQLQHLDTVGQPMGQRSYISDALFTQNKRQRVKLIECWYFKPSTVKTLRGEEHDGEEYDEKNEAHKAAVNDGRVDAVSRFTMQMHVAIMTENDLILMARSPYRHNRFPLTPVWGYRRARDNAPYGVIRGWRDAQEDLNKRHSKALFILSSTRTILDKDAVEDLEELREEVARPDSQIVKKKGSELTVERDLQLAEEHLVLMERDRNFIRNSGQAGVTDQSLGVDKRGLSGKAVEKLQDQGSLGTAELFDNYRLAKQLAGEKRLSLIEQYYTDTKTIRIVGNRGKMEFVPINKLEPVTGRVLNDITATKADYVVSEQDYRATIRQAMFDTLVDMVSRMDPAISIKFLDLVFQMNDDLPDREEFVARIRQINGFTPPDAKLSPEEQQAKAARDMEAAKQQKMADDLFMAELEEIIAKAKERQASALLKGAQATAANVGAMNAATEAGERVAINPGVAPIADELLNSAGFVDQNAPPIVIQPEAAHLTSPPPGGLPNG
jgi:hypothetical protein